IQRVLELEAVRIDRQNRRLSPGDELRSGPGFATRRVYQLRIPPGRAGRSADRLGPGLDLADDFDAPMAEIGRNLIPDFGPLDAAALPPSGEALVDPTGEAASASADDCRQCLHLPVVGMIINIEAGDPRRLSRPEVALPTADPHKAEIVELDVAIMALAEVPEQHGFTKAVVGRLGKGARAGNCAAAVVEPVADDMPARNVAHPGSPIGCGAAEHSRFA